MNIKDLFAKAENGTLTYEQFTALAQENKSKYVDLSEGAYVDRQKYTDELAARDTRITSMDEILKTRETDLADLQTKLQNAGTDSEKLGKLSTDFAELQGRYDKETKAYQKQLKDQAYKFAVTDFANQRQFTSQAAKRDFVNSMLAKNLQMEGDTIIGATDFVEAYSKENADAFAAEGDKGNNGGTPKPHFAGPTNPNGTDPGAKANPFHFEFAGVRPHKENE